jgi:hypothetical protein
MENTDRKALHADTTTGLVEKIFCWNVPGKGKGLIFKKITKGNIHECMIFTRDLLTPQTWSNRYQNSPRNVVTDHIT